MRILIADPEPKVRRALTVLLHEQSGWYVVGHAGTLCELEKQIKGLRPQIVLVDWALPGINHGEYIGRLAVEKSPVVIVMSLRTEIASLSQELGVKYFISKLESPDKLLEIFRTIQNNLQPAHT